MKTGRRVVIREFGESPLEAISQHLVIEDQAPPDPSTLAPNDVLVEVRSAQVNWVDLLMTSGQYQHMPAPPYTPGLEYAGVVVWVGSEVETPKLGDAVISDGLQTGPRSLGAHQRWGGFASYAVAPAQALLPLPSGWSFDQGCNLLGNYETAYHCLIACGGLRAGEIVLINGATGATGLAAVHIAKLVGATVIATGRSPDKLALVHAQGADHVLTTAEGLRDRVKALTGGRGVDVVYDGVGGSLSLESMRCCSFGARYLIVGWAATPDVAKGKGGRGAPNVNVLPTNLILMKGLHVIGAPTAIATHRDPSIRAPRLAAIHGWVAAGKLVPVIAEGYPLEQIEAAMLAKWANKTVGGIVVHP